MPKKTKIHPVYVLPNLFTSASLFSALCSIIATSDGRYVQACYFILLSAVLDALDGPVARWTRSASSFGLQYDSLADVVAFGVAPAFLMYSKLEMISQSVWLPARAPAMAISVCALFAICGALRLARFNIQVADEEKLHFTGLPIPAAAGTVVSSFLVIEQYIDPSLKLHRLILVLMLILAYLMVSTYPFPSLKGMKRRMRRSMNSLVTVVFFILFIVMFKQYFGLIAFTAFMSYLGLSLVHVVRAKRKLASYSPGANFPIDDEE